VLRNDYERLPQHYTGYGDYSDNSIQPRTFDLDKADQYFTEAGFVDRDGEGYRVNDQGQRLSFTVTYGTSIHNDRLVVLKEEARKAGVELVLELLDPQASYKKAQEKRHQIAWSGWSTGWRPAYRQHYHSDNAEKPGTNNITNTADPELDRMIEAYRASEDEAEKIGLSKEIQRMLHDRGALIPSYQVPYTRLGYWRWMQLPEDNYVTKTGGGLFDLFDPVAGGLFWIDRDLKKATEEAMDDEQPFDPVLIENTRWRAQVD
ncbi:MAG: ABC transporter substrate-binding protein, partial [Pseudomonadales bacterium]